jgi:hypothetical protein
MASKHGVGGVRASRPQTLRSCGIGCAAMTRGRIPKVVGGVRAGAERCVADARGGVKRVNSGRGGARDVLAARGCARWQGKPVLPGAIA